MGRNFHLRFGPFMLCQKKKRGGRVTVFNPEGWGIGGGRVTIKKPLTQIGG